MSISSASGVQHPAPIRPAMLIAMLVVAIALPSVGAAIAIPALPAIASDFGTDYGTAVLTQTSYLLGLALPQLFYGAISDRIGRRPTLLAGLILYVAGSLLSMAAPSIAVLMAGRLLQAVGGCAGIALGRAILRDLYSREKAASGLAYITMIMAAGPMLAPLLGGVLLEHFGWRSCFVVLAILGGIAVVVFWQALPETNPPGPNPARWTTLAAGFVMLLRLPRYRTYALPAACMSATYQVYVSTAAFIALSHFPMDAVKLGLWLLLCIVGFSFGSFLSGRFGTWIGVDRMIRLGTAINLAGACALAVSFVTPWFGPLAFFGLMTFMYVGQGLGIPNSVASATGVAPGLIGSAAGLTGFLQMALSAVVATMVGAVIEVSSWFLFGALVLLGVVSFAISLGSGRN